MAATMVSGVASAATFDFSTGVTNPQNIGNGIVTTISSGTVSFSVEASFNSGQNQDDAQVLLFDAGETQPFTDVEDRAADPDLVFEGIDTTLTLGGPGAGLALVNPTVFGQPEGPGVLATNKALVIGNRNGQRVNDQAGSGGTFTFTNTSAGEVTIDTFSFIDDLSATIFDTNGNLFASLMIDGAPGCSGNGDNCVGGLAFSPFLSVGVGQSFDVSINGSGGISGFTTVDDPSVTVVPLPGALPLLLAGLGGIALVGRRKA
ncbi:MAG: hypothetical protein AAF577_04235 [Pseudomonadota bacterium]